MKPATTITKVCRVLGEFRSRPSMGVTDLARRTDLLPSDIHRILTSLESCGYIEQDPQTKRYRLGCGLLKLSLTTCQRMSLREAGKPLLKRISEQLDATTHMAMFDSRDLEVFLVEQIDRPGEVLFRPRLGLPSGPHCTALGKTILASMDGEIIRSAVAKSGLPRMTAHTITEWNQLEHEFARIREQGYGIDREECVLGACCVGAPVRDSSGAVIASISASMMTQHFYRWDEARLGSLMKQAAAELSAAIGYEPKHMPDSAVPVLRRMAAARG
jgi:IclR family transcriptional regulator, KDG regulon repressor